jgi:hypothetical protein
MTILSSLIPSASADVVAVFLAIDNIPDIDLPGAFNELNIVQAFPGARPMSVQVAEPVNYAVHPLESGASVTDNRIILPIELSVSFIMLPEQYRETYLLMRQAKDLSLQFTVQTKTDNYTQLYISNMPHEETPEFFDTVTIILQFRQVQFFDTGIQPLNENDVLDPTDASTIDRGEQTPTTANETQDSQGSTLFRTFGGFI